MTKSRSSFLENASKSFPNTAVYQTLKNHFLWLNKRKCRNNNEVKPKDNKIVESSRMCQWCCQVWEDGKFTLDLVPPSVPGPRLKNILKKHKVAPEKLSKIENNLVRRYFDKKKYTMVLVCKICGKKSRTSFSKKIERKLSNEEDQLAQEVEEEKLFLKETVKKKKKRDKFAGLKAKAVLSISTSKKLKSKTVPLKISSDSLPRSSKKKQAGSVVQPNTSQPSSNAKNKYASQRNKFRALREEKLQEVKEKKKQAMEVKIKQNNKLKMKNKLQEFLSVNKMQTSMEDRINSLIQY